MPGVTFQEPTDLLRESDSLHLARREGGRSGRRDKGREACSDGSGKKRGGELHPGHLYFGCRLGPSSRAGPPPRAQEAARAAGCGRGDRGRRCTQGLAP